MKKNCVFDSFYVFQVILETLERRKRKIDKSNKNILIGKYSQKMLLHVMQFPNKERLIIFWTFSS
jgi:hypothetical protein